MKPATPRYSIGIDLGTTNSAVSYFELDHHNARGREQTMLALPQVTALGTVENKTLLPSFLYLPNPQEFPAGSLALPWDKKPSGAVVGEFVGGTEGLGVQILLMNAAMDVSGMFAVLLLLAAMGAISSRLLLTIRRRVLYWAPSEQRRGK